MDLLEREPTLAELGALLPDAAAGTGRVAAIAGEAGAGKTSLVAQFTGLHRDTVRTLRGLCDPLSTPRPLGPVHDMALQTSGPLEAADEDGDVVRKSMRRARGVLDTLPRVLPVLPAAAAGVGAAPSADRAPPSSEGDPARWRPGTTKAALSL